MTLKDFRYHTRDLPDTTEIVCLDSPHGYYHRPGLGVTQAERLRNTGHVDNRSTPLPYNADQPRDPAGYEIIPIVVIH